MIQELLQNIGLSRHESNVYMILLEMGPSEASKIAQLTRIGRVQTYRVLADLEKKGLVAEVIGHGKKMFVAEDGSVLKRFLGDQKRAIEEKMKLMEGGELELSKITNSDLYQTRVQYFEGRDGVAQIYDRAFEHDFDCYSDLERVNRYFPDTFYGIGSLYKLSKLKCRNILTDNAAVQDWKKLTKNLPLVQTKVLPDNQGITIDMLLWENHVAYVTFTADIISGVLIRSSDIYQSAKLQYDLLWERL